MVDIIKNISNSILSTSESLKKKGVFVNKPWIFIDNNNIKQKLIFKANKELVISENGFAKMGSWDYFSEAKSLLINLVTHNLLLNEHYIDENLLLFYQDGKDNELLALTNENTVPDCNILKYLLSLKLKKEKIRKVKLENKKTLLIHNANDIEFLHNATGHFVELLEDNFHTRYIENGIYNTSDSLNSFHIFNNKIIKAENNYLKTKKAEEKEKNLDKDGYTILLLNKINLKIHDFNRKHGILNSRNKYFSLFESNGNKISINGNSALSLDRNYRFYFSKDKIIDVKKIIIKEFNNEVNLEIEEGDNKYPHLNLGKKVTLFGKEIKEDKYLDSENYVFYIKKSKVDKIHKLRKYFLKSNITIFIEQQDFIAISIGDVVKTNNLENSKLEGKFSMRGTLKKIIIKNDKVVGYGYFI